MQILLNDNFTTQHSLITNNGVPTILNISADTSGSTAYFEMIVATGVSATKDYYLTLNGVSVYSTTSEKSALNNLFWVTPTTSYANIKAMAYYLVKALKSTSLGVDYNIYIDESFVSTTRVKIIVMARKAGAEYSLTVDTNLPYIYNLRNGSSAEDMIGARVTVDVYANATDNQKTLISANNTLPTTHITTLEKTFADSSLKFDLSSTLAMITPSDNTAEYMLVVNSTKQGNTRKIYTSPTLFAINGYQVNFGKDYFTYKAGESKDILLQNVSQGTQSEYLNATKLYYYPAEMFFVSFIRHSQNPVGLTIEYRDAAKSVISFTTEEFHSTTKNIYDVAIVPSDVPNARYLTVTHPSLGTLIYDNIIPNKYTNTIQTFYWRNSYGGISHFTFTGKQTETREIEKTTYNTSNLDYYYPIKRNTMVMDVTDKYTLSLTSHYCHVDAKYSLFDLLKATEVWIIVNGKRYDVIVDSVTINDIQRDTIQAEITYNYSTNHI